LLQQQKEHEASMAAFKAPPKPQEEPGWTEIVSKASTRAKQSEEKKQSGASATSNVTLQMEVPARHYPAIIGLKGETLGIISSVTGAKITVPRNRNGGTRETITIEGTQKGCAEASNLINELVEKGYTKATHPNVMSTTLILNNPAKERPILVGKGGVNITKLQRGTGARINLPKENEGKEVTIVGLPAACKKAREAIETLLVEGYSTVTHENFVRGEVEVPVEQYPVLIGKGGQTITQIQKSTGCRINIPNKEAGQNVTIIGPQDKVEEAREKILQILSRESNTVAEIVEEDPNDPWSAVNVNVNDEW